MEGINLQMMRNNNIKERRVDIAEVLYMHREEFVKLQSLPWNCKEHLDFVDRVIRPVIPYSCKTNNLDIWIGLSKFYNNRLLIS